MRIGGTLRLGDEKNLLRELAEGWREFRSREWLWVVVAACAVGNLVWMGGTAVLGPVVAKRYLGGPTAFGAIVAAESAGLLLGGLLALRLRVRRPIFVGVLALLPSIGLLACYAGIRWLPPLVAAAFVAGVGLELFNVYWITTLHEHIPPAVLSRVSSYDALGSFVFIPIGLTIAGPVAEGVGLTPALWIFAAVDLAALAAMLVSRDVRTLRAYEEPLSTAA
jgi:hypothetical protein